MSVVNTTSQALQATDLDSKRELIKRMFCKEATNDELELFMHACKRTGLDPFMKQIYAVKRSNQMTIQTGIDGFRLIAERTGNYSPGKEPTFTYDTDSQVISATAYVKKRTNDGTWHEVAAVAFYEEYAQKYNGKPSTFWDKMPHVMLAKCAEALALRKAFPAELSGIYTQDEMAQAVTKDEEMPAKLTENQCAILDSVLFEMNDESYNKKACSALGVKELYDMHPKDFERTITAYEKAIKIKNAKKEGYESAGVA